MSYSKPDLDAITIPLVKKRVFVAMTPKQTLRVATGFAPANNEIKNRMVFVVSCTKEGLMFGLELGPLKFERSKRGGDYTSRKTPVATI